MTVYHWFVVVTCCLAFSGTLSACGSIPQHLQYRSGSAPQNVDKEVRFRTTNYFGVYDFCEDIRTGNRLQPVTDSLYRFIMTGKANAFSNTTAFESGTLTADQIAPFGASIEIDEATGAMRVVGDSELAARRRNQVALNDIETLVKLRQKLAALDARKTAASPTEKDESSDDQESGEGGDAPALSEAIDAVDAQIKAAAARVGTPATKDNVLEEAAGFDGAMNEQQEAKLAILCLTIYLF